MQHVPSFRHVSPPMPPMVASTGEALVDLSPPAIGGMSDGPVAFDAEAGIVLRATAPSTADTAAPPPVDPLDALIGRIRGRDESAMNELHEACAARLLAWALRVAHKPEMADEAVSASLLQVWHHAVEFDAHRASASTWLRTIVRSRMIDLMRSARRRSHHEQDASDGELEAMPDAAPEPSSRLENAQANRTLRRAMATLTPVQRQVLSLTFLEGFSQQEAAEHIGLPLGTVKSHSKRGLEVLRRHRGLKAVAG